MTQTARYDRALRPLAAGAFAAPQAVAADPILWEQHPLRERHQNPVFARFFDDALASCGALLVIDTAKDLVIGASRFNAPDPAPDQVEIGWSLLARTPWGTNVNQEVKHCMLVHAFPFLSRVIFRVGASNRRSRRATEKSAGG